MFGKSKMSLVLTLVLSLILFGSTFASAFDLTQFGLKPAEEYDLGGATVTIISWTSDRMSKYFQDNLAVMGRVEEAERIFNCKINWMQDSNQPDINFNRLLAGESTHDIWHVQNKKGYWQLVANGAVIPLSDILPPEYYEAMPPTLIATEEALKYNGKYWGAGPVEWRPVYGYQNDMIFVAYNKTMFEREGIEDLYELYLAGEWTWDKATEIAVKLTADLDGDGETDQWGIVDVRPWDLAVSNGASITREDENGRVIFTADEPAYLEALEQYYTWWSELEVVMPTYGSSTLRDTFINGKAGMYFYVPAYSLSDQILPNMVDEWGLVPYPKGPRMDEYSWTVQALNTTLIPINAKDPEALVALRTFLWREEDIDTNDLLAAHVKSREAADVFLTANREWDGNASRLFEKFLGDFQNVTREVARGAKSPAAAMAELKPVIQSNLDFLFNQ